MISFFDHVDIIIVVLQSRFGKNSYYIVIYSDICHLYILIFTYAYMYTYEDTCKYMWLFGELNGPSTFMIIRLT